MTCARCCNRSYLRLLDDGDFSGKYDTYIIGYDFDRRAWLTSNEGHFWYEYPKEFNTKAEAVDFFNKNLDLFFDLNICMGNGNRLYFLDTGKLYKRDDRYDSELFDDVVQYCLDEGIGIEYEGCEDVAIFSTEKEICGRGSKRKRYVSWETIQWFLAKENIEYTKYMIQKRKTGDIDGTRLLAYDEWRMMCKFFKCPKLTFEDAMEISKTLYKYDVEILDIIMGEDDD